MAKSASDSVVATEDAVPAARVCADRARTDCSPPART
jgi:hypothetical protein